MKKFPKEFTLDVGTIVKINGLPYALVEETKVSGFHEPEFPTYSELDDSSRQERTVNSEPPA